MGLRNAWTRRSAAALLLDTDRVRSLYSQHQQVIGLPSMRPGRGENVTARRGLAFYFRRKAVVDRTRDRVNDQARREVVSAGR